MIYLKEYNNYDNKVAKICKKFDITDWSIRDGLVDVDGNVFLWGIEMDKLPFKFGRVSGIFDCSGTELITLEGSPIEVGDDFDFVFNNITTLEGGPKKVGGNLRCNNNKLTTLEHIPDVGGDIYISGNPLPEEILNLTQEQLKKVVYDQEFYEIWRDGKLFLPRWKELKLDMGL